MTPDERSRFEAAEKTVHPVTCEWHYSIMTARGFVPETSEAPGFVRRYDYTHPLGHRIRCVTGSSTDYWNHPAMSRGGYWSSLESYLDDLLLTVKSTDA